MDYPFTNIWINGRFVSLDEILHADISCNSVFEDHFFDFIRQWLSGVNEFRLQTSGSTGDPTTIIITRDQLKVSAGMTEKALQLERYSNALICIDPRYIGGKMMIVRSFVTGMRMWAVDPSASPLQKLPVDQCVNFAALVPYQVQKILGSKHPHLLNNPDRIIIGGAPLSEEIIGQLQPLLCRCYATYGMTETVSHVALRKLNGKDRGDYFEALPGIKLYQDERNCLVIEAPQLTGTVVTNDIVEMNGPQKFRWLGRLDNIINTGGIKVIPEKIEAAVSKIFSRAGIRNRFFVHGMTDKEFGTKIILVVESSSNSEQEIEKSLSELRQEISPYEMPREVMISPSFTLTDTGKINRLKTLSSVTASFSLKK